VDTSRPEVREAYAEIIEAIRDQGLVYPVTVIDGAVLHDGAVSYPAIMRAVEARIAERREA
jgi:disulfide oxidoreductase YuzD